MKKVIKDTAELFLYLVPVFSMFLVKILDNYCDIWYYLICFCALVAQIILYAIAKSQQELVQKQKENFDNTFNAKYNEKGNVVSTRIDPGTF
jgi:hypothetical protein